MIAGYASFSLREHAARHPMAVFALAAGIALASIGTVAGEGSAYVGAPAGAPERTDAIGRVAPKADRLRARTEAELACAGQSWGSESGKCLLAILRESGKTGSARIRTISGA